MIAARCEKCKNIGCNSDTFLCNNWSEEKRKEYADQYKTVTDFDKVTNISLDLCGSTLRGLERLTKRTPNDMELGKLVRDFFAGKQIKTEKD